ncbi:MAG: hypothetical protein JWQ49_2582 [Edaphobacter sp.]|nr:hypothetical protein [Edaphobacter sp.]
MCGFQEKVEVSLAWGVPAFGIAYIGEDPRLVKDCPGVDSVAHSFDDDLDIVGKTGGSVAVGPSALVFEGLRKIPAEERDKGPHACAENGVGEALVVIDTFLV